MKLLIKQAHIVDFSSAHYRQQVDILLEEGVICAIEPHIDPKDSDVEVISHENLHVSQGWVDLKSDFCDPGNEHKETICSGLQVAARGGYTHVAILPSTQPVIDGKTQVEYALKKGQNLCAELHPIGSITEQQKGEKMAELYDMYLSGVRLFSDDMRPVSSKIVELSLLYTKNFGGTVMLFSHDKSLSKHGMINEGTASLRTGLRADPSISEVIELERNIRLLEYTGGSLHLTGISCAQSVDIIRKAKKKLPKLTADVHLANLLYTEQDVLQFDTNYKFLPVLRTEQDRIALWEGLKDGTIDTVVSNHRPNDSEDKNIEFDLAAFGNIQLQTVFGNLGNCQEFDNQTIVDALSLRARKILSIQERPIEVGCRADMTLFIPNKKWIFQPSNNLSKTHISECFGRELTGWIVGIIHRGNHHIYH